MSPRKLPTSPEPHSLQTIRLRLGKWREVAPGQHDRSPGRWAREQKEMLADKNNQGEKGRSEWKTNTSGDRQKWGAWQTYFLPLECWFWTFQNIKPKHFISQQHSPLMWALFRSPPIILSPLRNVFCFVLLIFFFETRKVHSTEVKG